MVLGSRGRQGIKRALVTAGPLADRAATLSEADVDAVRGWLTTSVFEVAPHLVAERIRVWAHGLVGEAVPGLVVAPGCWDRLLDRYRPHPVVLERARMAGHPVAVQPEGRVGPLDRVRRGRYATDAGRRARAVAVDALLEGIAREGLLPRPRADGRVHQDEIGVYVTRHGRLVWARQGDHRLSAAQVLGVARVPVILRGVHSRFVANARPQPDVPVLAALRARLAAVGVAEP